MMSGTSALLVDSTISDCAAVPSYGGGMLIEFANVTLRRGSYITRCNAYRGGGMLAASSDVALLDGSVISECSACVGAAMRSGPVDVHS